MEFKDIFVIIISSFLDSINPCAISVLIITLSFLLVNKEDKKFIFKVGFVYIFAIFLTYFLIGVGILKVFNILGIPRIISKITSAILIFYGLIELLGAIFKNFPIRPQIIEGAKETIASLISRASFSSSFILGFLVGSTEFPCTGGPYFFVLSLLNEKTTFIKGLFYLFIYNLIFILPLILILFLSTKYIEKIEIIKKRSIKTYRIISGLIFFALGLFVLLS